MVKCFELEKPVTFVTIVTIKKIKRKQGFQYGTGVTEFTNVT
jgi:hypothetical protein